MPALYASSPRRCPVPSDGVLGLLEEPGTYRLYHFCRCGMQVCICAQCDCGNLYCPGDYAEPARRESVRRAGARYQRTLRGARRHAERQRCYRQRRRQEVTHHGLFLVTRRYSVSRRLVSASESIDVDVKEPPRPPTRLLQTRCAFCGRPLPAFTRLHAWRWSG